MYASMCFLSLYLWRNHIHRPRTRGRWEARTVPPAPPSACCVWSWLAVYFDAESNNLYAAVVFNLHLNWLLMAFCRSTGVELRHPVREQSNTKTAKWLNSQRVRRTFVFAKSKSKSKLSVVEPETWALNGGGSFGEVEHSQDLIVVLC